MMLPILFFVFSYNRGPFLEHCVESIGRCAPDAEIIIFDDQSTDPETQRVLGRLSARHRVVSSGGGLGHKHGGLYANMQAALETVADDRLICFTQDDTQMVRTLTAEDRHSIDSYFSGCDDIGFVSPSFLQGRSLRRAGAELYRFDGDVGLWFRKDCGRSAGTYYSDIFLSRSDRLRQSGWVFAQGEHANEDQARAKFNAMGYMPLPFMMWLPNGAAYRGRTKTLALKVAELVRRAGLYPLQYMTETDVRQLLSAFGAKLPVAEDFLKVAGGELKKPWIYTPLQGSRLLKHLNQAELLVRSIFR